MKLFLFVHVLIALCYGDNWTKINLPESHVPFFFRNNPDVRRMCDVDDTCPYKTSLKEEKCWGYEDGCPIEQRLSIPTCTIQDKKRSRHQEPPQGRFWKEGDFGYVKGKRDELYTFCRGEKKGDSFLKCTKYARYCYAKNLYIDMTNGTLERVRKNSNRYPDFWQRGEIGGHCTCDKDRFRQEDRDKRQLASCYSNDFWRDGEICGYCKFDKDKFQQEHGEKEELESWYAEFERFTELPFRPTDNTHCDVIFDKPVIFMQLDAGVNMYHHFCDFVNLYISQHINNSFSTDVQIIFWMLNTNRYGDLFKETFDAFTELPIDFLYNYHSKRICVREAMFPTLPRASHGLFYSTPLTPGCHGSSLFKAFSEHLVHRLNIPHQKPKKDKIRVTLLDRAAHSRNILNQIELANAVSAIEEYDVTVVQFKFREMPFLEQVKISHNSDIFIGMHGAGLTHMLFQPDWGAVIELYNCEDVRCYLDLARLRGLKYITWDKPDKVYPQSEDPAIMPKSNNYTFDNEEFLKMVAMAADHVRAHPKFIEERGLSQRDEL